jgi:hypothetical protein
MPRVYFHERVILGTGGAAAINDADRTVAQGDRCKHGTKGYPRPRRAANVPVASLQRL